MFGLFRKKRNKIISMSAVDCEPGHTPISPLFYSLHSFASRSKISRREIKVVSTDKTIKRFFDLDRFIQLDRAKGGQA
jgi:hypothetical protein